MRTQELTAKIKTFSFPRIWLSPFIKALFAALFAALMSKLSLFGTSSPFGIAAALSFSGTNLILSCMGAIWGYCSGFTAFSAKYTVSVILGGMTKFILSKMRRLNLNAVSAVSATVNLLICGFVAVRLEPTVFNISAVLGEALLSGGSCFIFSSAIPFLQNPFSRLGLSKKDNAALLITLSLITSSLAQFEFYGFSFGRTICIYFILLSGMCGNESFSSVFGITCGAAIALSSPNLMFMALILPLGGLLCGVFSGGGKLACAGAYLFGCGISVIYTGINDAVFSVLYESLLSCAFFIITPHKFSNNLSSFFFSVDNNTTRDSIARRLENTKAGLCEVAATIRKVGKNLNNVNCEDITTVFDSAADTVCNRCGLKNVCWVENYGDTLDKLCGVIPILKGHGRIITADLPSDFANRCAKPAELTAAINRHYSTYDAKYYLNSHTANMRKMLADQFEALSDIFSQIKEDYCFNEYNDTVVAKKIRRMFENEHLDVTDCRCFVLKQGYYRIEVDYISDEDICINKENLSDRLYDICGRRFESPKIEITDQIKRIVITEKVNFQAEFSAVCLAAGNNKLCGDSYGFVQSDDGRAVAIISDGMGSGSMAALESKMAVTLLSKLIRYGFSYESALEIVNWSLMVKSQNEMLTTLDMLSVDLYTGESSILKAGAPSSFILRGNDVSEVEFPSCPIGILNDVSFAGNKLKLSNGDLAVLVSDGAVTGDSTWLQHEIRLFDGDLDSFVRNLAEKAKARRPSGQDDDVTVVAVRLKSA